LFQEVFHVLRALDKPISSPAIVLEKSETVNFAEKGEGERAGDKR
jgi:hypothetical protein